MSAVSPALEMGSRLGLICPVLSQDDMVSRWLAELLKRKPPKLAAVALANKMARIAGKLMVSGETYSAQSGPTLKGCAT